MEIVKSSPEPQAWKQGSDLSGVKPTAVVPSVNQLSQTNFECSDEDLTDYSVASSPVELHPCYHSQATFCRTSSLTSALRKAVCTPSCKTSQFFSAASASTIQIPCTLLIGEKVPQQSTPGRCPHPCCSHPCTTSLALKVLSALSLGTHLYPIM